MTEVWPTYLPIEPLVVGHAQTLAGGIVRTPMESGRARQRRAMAPGPQRVMVSWSMTGNQLKVFKVWLEDVIHYTDFFNIDLVLDYDVPRTTLSRFTDQKIVYQYVTQTTVAGAALFLTGSESHIIFLGDDEHVLFTGDEGTVTLGDDALFFTGSISPPFLLGSGSPEDNLIFTGVDDVALFLNGENLIFTGDPDNIIFHEQATITINPLDTDLWQVDAELEVIDEESSLSTSFIYRTTEAGDDRLTETGNQRIT